MRLGIAAPRVTVRTELPWHWRALAVAFLSACSLALAGWIYDAGLRFAGYNSESSAQELAELRDRATSLSHELVEARKIANSSDSRLRIESTTLDRLAAQIKSLGTENARLKADLAMYENLAGSDSGPPGIEISRMQVSQEDDTGKYRYRLLIAQRGSERDKEFKGSLRLIITLAPGSQPAMIEIPGNTATSATGNAGNDTRQFAVVIRHFGKLEGVFQVAANTRIHKVEARLLEGSSVKASRSVVL